MVVFRLLPLLGLLLMTPGAETQTPATTLSVDVNVVTLPVTVRDKHGKTVTNLTKEDFILEEDNKPQTVRYLNLESNLPLTVGLLVDTSLSERDNLEKERAASKAFLNQMITHPTDRAFVVHFDRDVELLQDLTADRGKLEKAVSEIDTPSAVEAVPSGGQPRAHGAGTLLYDAIFLSCDEVAKKQKGRKAIVVLTDGEDRGSQETLNGAIESCQRAETVVYTVYYGGHKDRDSSGFNGPYPDDDDQYPGGRYPGRRYPGGGYPGGGYPGGGYPYPRGQQQTRPDGKKNLQRIALETGGRYFQLGKKDSVDDAYGSIAEELRTQFVLGYTPPKDHASGYHAIHLTTKDKDQTVQTRAGYYSGQ